ncbi:MAG TPA: hypothetical protein VNR37_03405 [Microbacteriaceae bacterium]|nr:hypothetical protein [Microbacteriaceae bacterium]
MKRTNEIQGTRRLPDLDYRENFSMRKDPPGTYVKIVNFPPMAVGPTNLTGDLWFVITPNGLLGNLGNHTVREEDDGTISVNPGDGSSNSILVNGGEQGSWHGYITRGLWWSLA